MAKKDRERHWRAIVKFYKEGNNISNIAQKLKINRLDVKKVLIEEGIYIETRFILRDDLNSQNLILDLYINKLKSIYEIEKITNFKVDIIKRFLKSKNIEFRGAKFHNRKYACNDEAFSFYTPESVYWAGFIAGDGCIYSHGLSNKENNYIAIGLNSIDIKHLEKLKNFLKYTGILYLGNNKASLVVNSIKIVQDLNKLYDITNNKTNTYSPPEKIPENLKKYFILGLIDSDGGIQKIKRPPVKRKHIKGNYVFQLGFTGTKESCEFMQNFFQNKVKMFSRHKNGINNFSIIFQGNIQVLNYLNTLYDLHSIDFCLERKYAKYLELVKQYNYSRP